MMTVHTGTWGWAAATALAALVALPAAAGPARIESLVAAERAFSALSVQKGIKPSFLAYLAPDAVVFRPTAMNGPKTIAARPAPTATLVWEPAYAEISSAGDLGCTTGPWEMHPMGLASAPVAFGHFISVWKKQADGAWRVAVDIGTSHGKPASGGVGSGEFVAGPAHAARAVAPAALRRLDVAYSSAARTQGLAAAFTKNAAQDVRFNTDGLPPLVGIDAARAQVGKLRGRFAFVPQGSGIAASRDLGYTYGIAPRFEPGASTAADSAVYMHVWRRGANGAWRIALAVLNPLPKPGTD